MKAIHLKCVKDDERPRGLIRDKETGTYTSCCWDIPVGDAQELVGGWIYLHLTKNDASYFGGVILGIEEMTLPDAGRPKRIIFRFEPRLQGKEQPWRGRSFMMAWTSGLVDADFAHEQA